MTLAKALFGGPALWPADFDRCVCLRTDLICPSELATHPIQRAQIMWEDLKKQGFNFLVSSLAIDFKPRKVFPEWTLPTIAIVRPYLAVDLAPTDVNGHRSVVEDVHPHHVSELFAF